MKKKANHNQNTNKGGKKMLPTILGIVLALIAVVVVLVSVTAAKNVKVMNHCVDSALSTLQEYYIVTPIDVGDYKEMKINPIMKFHVEQYNIEELGNLSVMRVNMGIMQMATFVITPTEKNLPLLSADYMYILGNRKSYLEFYDVVKNKDEQYTRLLGSIADAHKDYDHLENVETTPAWYAHLLTVTAYKGGKASADKDLENLLIDSLTVYLEQSKQFPLLSEEEMKEKLSITVDYTDGLIKKGGISTDVFKKSLGDEATKLFFDKVFFGTALK